MAELVPFVGPSYKLNTPEADVQRVVNMYPVRNEVAGGKTGVYLEAIPGLDLFSAPTPPASGYFLDRFNGAAGSIVGHVPDVAPAGFTWVSTAAGPTLLSGSGSAYNASGSSYANANAAPASWVAMELGTSWLFEVTGHVDNGTSEGGPSFTVVARTNNDSNGIRIQFATASGTRMQVGVSVEGASYFSDSILYDTYNAKVYVSPTGFALYIDGDFVASVPFDMTAFESFVGMHLDYDGGAESAEDAAIDEVAIYPDTATPPAPFSVVTLNPNDPDGGATPPPVYFTEYLAEFPDLGGFDPGAQGFTSTGSSGTLASINDVRSVTVPAADTASAKGATLDVSGGFFLGEFTVRALGANAKVAVGSFSPSFGPPGTLDSYLLGFPSLCTYWASNGVAFGYGGSDQAVATYGVGDVIGLVIDDTSTAHWFKNGVLQGFTTNVADNNSAYLFASATPV